VKPDLNNENLVKLDCKTW